VFPAFGEVIKNRQQICCLSIANVLARNSITRISN